MLSLVALTALAHLPCLTGGLVWDDVEIVTERPAARSVRAALGQLARYRPWQRHKVGTPRPRPLRDLSLALCHSIWGRRVWGYHLVNLLLHLAAVAAAFLALRRVVRPASAAWAAAAIFAVHPAVVEAVAQLKNRGDALAAIACLASLWLAVEGRGGAWRWAASLALYVAALLCAEWAAAAPLAFIPIVWLAGGGPRALRLLSHLALGLLAAYWTAGATSGLALPLAARLAHNAAAYASIISAVGPGSPMVESAAAWRIGAAALLGAALVLGLVSLRSRRLAIYGALWAGVIVGPLCLATPALSGRLVAAHRVYFAAIGAGLALASLVRGAGGKRWLALVGLVVVVLACRTTGQHLVWTDARSLWRTCAAAAPRSPLCRLGLGNSYAHRGKFDAAARELVRGEALAHRQPGDWRRLEPDLMHNLGLVRLKQNRPMEAAVVLEAAAELGETSAIANSLGIAFDRMGLASKAMAAYKRALALDPANADAHHNLGNSFSQQGDAAAAAKQYREAIRLDPDAVLSHLALGRALYYEGDLDAARRCFKAAARGPCYADAHALLGLTALDQGRKADARRHLQLALQADPRCWCAHLLRAEIAEADGDAKTALEAYQRVLELKPDQAEVRKRVEELSKGRVD